jgi:Zn-dependent protease with chaperone function
MLAISTTATIVSAVWVGALTLVLVAQAVRSWWAWRHVARAARQAARLARAMEQAAQAPQQTAPTEATVVELHRSPASVKVAPSERSTPDVRAGM